MSLTALALTLLTSQQVLPVVEVVEDNTRIDQSCVVRISPDLVIADEDGNGVIHIGADEITVVFEKGTVLRGAAPGTPGDGMEGIGVRLADVQLVQLKGLRVEGFRCGVLATRCDGLQVEGGLLKNNYRQRLGSTPAAEDNADWLWPHDNDEQQWRKRYGAGLCVEDSRKVSIRDLVVREQQNGIILDRVSFGKILSNDCSFLSGWGIAMWRSCDNEVRANRLDYNVRGYSHGIYNRGQDSAGLLMFEQCSRNRIISNSATHGGDGIFAFSGKEALGENPAPAEDFDYARRGNNDNLFLGNRLDYAVAHGLELTFGFGNTIQGNSFRGNGICGVWAGFSQETLILDNDFEGNGEVGYGLERGGINIDHSRGNVIQGNRFAGDRCGVHIWSHPTGFSEMPWGRANDLTAVDNLLAGNRFQDVDVGVHLRGAVVVRHAANEFHDSAGEWISSDAAFLLEDGASAEPQEVLEDLPFQTMDLVIPEGRGMGDRASIQVSAWGPWDFESPLWQLMSKDGTAHVYRALPAGAPVMVKATPGNAVEVTRLEGDSTAGTMFRVEPTSPGFQCYVLTAEIEGQAFESAGSFLNAPWTVSCFLSVCDPREDVERWREGASAEGSSTWQMQDLSLKYASGGPQKVAPKAITGIPETSDHFGTIATSSIELPAGNWKIRVLSDDGVRLWAGGKLLVDHWTHHAPAWDEAQLVVSERRTVDFRVEHFELDGFAVLEVSIEQLR
ncbi:MAG: NosD domain-containing protein [Planctomycetota bacterium]|jgi:parallel beta-helix repeat protein